MSMGEKTGIPWTDHTFNAFRGCTKVSDGCRFCYAETLAKRFPDVHGIWGDAGTRVVAKDWRGPVKWNRRAGEAGVRERVFTASMGDVFEDRPELIEPRARLFRLIDKTPHLDWLVLTKRPENIERLHGLQFGENVWVGVTAENQEMWDLRVPILCTVEAAVRFISMEPCLERIDMGLTEDFPKPDWVIVGAESGPKRRPFERQWARDIRDELAYFDIPFFYKQEIGDKGEKIETPPLDGVVHVAFPDD